MFCFVTTWVLLVLLNYGPAAARKLAKRDAVLETLQIPLNVNSDGKYSVNVTMAPTSPAPQNFQFALSLSSGLTYVAGENCPSCHGSSSYNSSASTTVKDLNGTQGVAVLNNTVTGRKVKEDCLLHQKNGSDWSYPNQTVVVADNSTFQSSSGISGLIGLGLNSNGNFSDTVFGGWLSRNPSMTNFSYGMQLNKPDDPTSTDGGILHWIVPDSSAYQGVVSWKPMKPQNVSATNTAANASATSHPLDSDWRLDLDSWAFNTDGGSFVQSGVTLQAVLDPFFPSIYFPQGTARLIYNSVPTASVISGSTASHVYKVPCDLKISLSVTFGSITVTLDEKTLVKSQSDGTCVGVIEEWGDSAVTDFMFGSSFISNVYLIFAIAASEAQVGIAARKTAPAKKALSTGAIVGIAIGSAVFASLVVGLTVWYFLSRKRKSPVRVTPASQEEKSRDTRYVVDPFPSPRSPGSPGSPSFSAGGSDQRGLLAGNSPPVSPDWSSGPSQYVTVSHPSQGMSILDGPDTPPPYVNTMPVAQLQTPITAALSPQRRKEREARGTSDSSMTM